ncbi:MAG: hypothetical protein DI536_20605 [Archangium gephyra]|uniref:Uncharacterized protein n=1 Tax=Archangium gephyra TaxID=48 RepID=A0A2W5T8H2_9BACT|nr:MAG: hypothetical protein DI536_20605 [Archangium gephyra]
MPERSSTPSSFTPFDSTTFAPYVDGEPAVPSAPWNLSNCTSMLFELSMTSAGLPPTTSAARLLARCQVVGW